MVRLQEMKKQSTVDNHRREEAMNRIKELQDFVTGQRTDIYVFDEALVRKLIKTIAVYADKFTVGFKSGVSVDIAE
jgi:predicted oxidoreductase (fatty acid repression mutant protein)